MKFIFSQMAFFLTQQSNRRNLRFMRNFFILLVILIILYTGLFHAIMLEEDKHYSILTGLYWTLTVMSTLGFGDITFTSDLGRMFSLLVLLSGIILIMLIMPFTFIRFIYVPWIEAHNKAKTPHVLPEETQGHTLIIGSDSIARGVADKMRDYNLPYFLLIDSPEKAFSLYDSGYSVMRGEADCADTYRLARAEKASLVIALEDEYKNSNIAATMREVTEETRLAATADHDTAESILYLAGCSHVFCFPFLLGQSMAKRVYDVSMHSHIIARFESLCIAEAPTVHSSLVGKSILEADFRGRYGLNVVGIWQDKRYMHVLAETIIKEDSILLLAGTESDLERFDSDLCSQTTTEQKPVIILGAGRVGKGVAQTLAARGLPYKLVDKNPKALPKEDNNILVGDASDLAVLIEAGIENTNTVVVTTHNDDVNIYLTIFCRKLRPEIQIISRSTLDRNVASLYNAGATLVMSQSSYTANTILNLLKPQQVVMLTEGLNIFRVAVPPKLLGKSIIESGIRNATNCNAVAIAHNGEMEVPINPKCPLAEQDELILIGTVENEILFHQVYGV